jgi:hypothetical protein
LTYAAKKVGAKLRIRYRAKTVTSSVAAGANGQFTVAVFIDAITNAAAWNSIPLVANITSTYPLDVSFEAVITATDTLSHVYEMVVFYISLGVAPNSLSRRLFTIEEAA